MIFVTTRFEKITELADLVSVDCKDLRHKMRCASELKRQGVRAIRVSIDHLQKRIKDLENTMYFRKREKR